MKKKPWKWKKVLPKAENKCEALALKEMRVLL
jgi:hypothetical protein